MKRLTKIVLLITFFVSLFCFCQKTYQYKKPTQLNDGWQTSDLTSHVIDTTKIYAFFNQLINVEHKIHSVLLIKNNQLVLEEYFDGEAIDKPHDLRSTNKSIKSILLGIAIDKGFISSVNDPISKYLKQSPTKNIDSLKNDITIKHLITMSTGLECNDWDKSSKGQEDKVYKKEDWIQYTLNLPIVNKPGTVSNYCSMGVVLLAKIIEEASGMTIQEFAKKYVFDELNIQNYYWEHTSKKEIISAGKRLYLTSRDFAKIGQLILNKGKWNGKQIVSETWIEEATTPKTKITGLDYGYLWWNLPFFNINDKNLINKTATGNGGQYIIVFPELELLIVFTGKAFNSDEQMVPFSVVNKIFLPSFSK